MIYAASDRFAERKKKMGIWPGTNSEFYFTRETQRYPGGKLCIITVRRALFR